MAEKSIFTRINTIEGRGVNGFYAVLDVAPPFQRLINGRREATRAFNERALAGQIQRGGPDVSLKKHALKHLHRAEAAVRARSPQS